MRPSAFVLGGHVKSVVLILSLTVFTGCKQREARLATIYLGSHYDVSSEVVVQPKFDAADRELVRLVLIDLINAESTKASRDFYAPGAKTVLLKTFGSPIEWPANFNPSIAGLKVFKDQRKIHDPTALGVDLRYYGPPRNGDAGIESGNDPIVIQMTIYSAVSIGTIGAADVKYIIYKKDKKIVFLTLEDA